MELKNGLKEGLNKRYEKAVLKNGKLEIAKKLLSFGMTKDEVIQITELTKEDLDNIITN